MLGKFSEIEEVLLKIESRIGSLARERDEAVAEAARLRTQLDEREMELLQLDEELQREKKRFEEERQVMMQDQVDTEQRLENVAARIKAILPLLPALPTDNDN